MVLGHVLAQFRYGREDLDVLGLTFRKELYLASEQIFPPPSSPEVHEVSHNGVVSSTTRTGRRPLTRLQERLVKKLGPNAYPFYFELPPHCPASVTLQPAPGDTGKPCVRQFADICLYSTAQYKCTVALVESESSVRLAIRKIMYAPSVQGDQPSIEVSKEFMMSPNKLHLEASLDKELYHHGENIAVNVHIANNSNRTVKKIKVSEMGKRKGKDHEAVPSLCRDGCPVGPGFTLSKVHRLVPRLLDNRGKRGLALDGRLKDEDTNLASSTVEGCPVAPGFTLSKVFTVKPLLADNKDKWGLALDGQLKHEDTNLASSTPITDPSQKENLGIIVQYRVKVKLCLGPLGGDLVAELPFTLMHPEPEEESVPPIKSVGSEGDTAVEGSSAPKQDPALSADTNLIQLDTYVCFI
ncbi:hypothetical protein J437_LFUL011035 [Ladona fulva]|uniref:Arrestin C-terminal-like domain-containing protein n=1 Tax=Ladona fulva TaxID=123851 RepID=A0A8K0P4L8_LADFU|nr:hypothetical protein J437_LFUL011035 [Ladona fulva]